MAATVILRIVCILAALGGALGPLAAHMPYWGRSETIRLPDGSLGQLRLLHGDGIFFADPVRAVVVDGNGKALARSHWGSPPVAIFCPEQHRCSAFHFGSLVVMEPDPATFREGPDLSGYGHHQFAGGDEEWGFSYRRATIAEALRAHGRHAVESPGLLLFAGLTTLAITIAFGKLLPRTGSKGWHIVYLIVLISLRVAVALSLLAANLLLAMSGEYPGSLWLAANAAGILIAAMIIRRRRLRNPDTPAPATKTGTA